MTVNNEINDKMEVREDTDIWNLYQINQLHVSTDPAVLDNVGSEFLSRLFLSAFNALLLIIRLPTY